MKFIPYRKEELEDPLWLRKKESILRRDGYKCVIPDCKGKKGIDLHVHFKLYLFNQKEEKYVLPWKYDNEYLVTLCGPHYRKTIRIFKIGTKNIN